MTPVFWILVGVLVEMTGRAAAERVRTTFRTRRLLTDGCPVLDGLSEVVADGGPWRVDEGKLVVPSGWAISGPDAAGTITVWSPGSGAHYFVSDDRVNPHYTRAMVLYWMASDAAEADRMLEAAAA